jgi:hypothetical protein
VLVSRLTSSAASNGSCLSSVADPLLKRADRAPSQIRPLHRGLSIDKSTNRVFGSEQEQEQSKAPLLVDRLRRIVDSAKGRLAICALTDG